MSDSFVPKGPKVPSRALMGRREACHGSRNEPLLLAVLLAVGSYCKNATAKLLEVPGQRFSSAQISVMLIPDPAYYIHGTLFTGSGAVFCV